MSSTLKEAFGQALVSLVHQLLASSQFETGVPRFDALSLRQRIALLIRLVQATTEDRRRSLFPTVWADTAIVAVFKHLDDVLAYRLDEDEELRSSWQRAINLAARRPANAPDDWSAPDEEDRVIAVREKFLNTPWRRDSSGRWATAFEASDERHANPASSTIHDALPTFWESPPPDPEEIEWSGEARYDLEFFAWDALRPWPPEDRPANHSTSSRAGRTVRI